MITLVEPCERYLQSYMEAHDEYEMHGVGTYAFDDARAYNIFEKYDNYRKERNLPQNRVGSHFYWFVDEERNYFIGEISIRHRLTDSLRRYGGHIGYGVRFSEGALSSQVQHLVIKDFRRSFPSQAFARSSI